MLAMSMISVAVSWRIRFKAESSSLPSFGTLLQTWESMLNKCVIEHFAMLIEYRGMGIAHWAMLSLIPADQRTAHYYTTHISHHCYHAPVQALQGRLFLHNGAHQALTSLHGQDHHCEEVTCGYVLNICTRTIIPSKSRIKILCPERHGCNIQTFSWMCSTARPLNQA